MLRLSLICFCLISAPLAATAEVELSFYGGVQSAPPSDIKIRGDDVIADDDFEQDWEGRSAEAPIYYGIRATHWRSSTFGYGLDFTHNKVYPEDDDLPDGYEVLEFTDGINTLTVNAYRRWDGVFGQVSPYVGGGLGVALPHVEVTNNDSETFGYQITGPAATWIAGASYEINNQWAIFGEYKGTLSANSADLEDGGTLETDIVTNALNFGVSFNF